MFGEQTLCTPAKMSGIWMIIMGTVYAVLWGYDSIQGLVKWQWQPGYHLATGLMMVGAGCVLLVYHVLKNGGEDAHIKKIILQGGIGGAVAMAALQILDIWHIL